MQPYAMEHFIKRVLQSALNRDAMRLMNSLSPDEIFAIAYVTSPQIMFSFAQCAGKQFNLK